jgi:hypothetical protein
MTQHSGTCTSSSSALCLRLIGNWLNNPCLNGSDDLMNKPVPLSFALFALSQSFRSSLIHSFHSSLFLPLPVFSKHYHPSTNLSPVIISSIRSRARSSSHMGSSPTAPHHTTYLSPSWGTVVLTPLRNSVCLLLTQ